MMCKVLIFHQFKMFISSITDAYRLQCTYKIDKKSKKKQKTIREVLEGRIYSPQNNY